MVCFDNQRVLFRELMKVDLSLNGFQLLDIRVLVCYVVKLVESLYLLGVAYNSCPLFLVSSKLYGYSSVLICTWLSSALLSLLLIVIRGGGSLRLDSSRPV